MNTLYDVILVYGARDIYDPITAYSFPEIVARKTAFVGYICDQQPAVPDRVATATGRKRVVVTVGGGEDGQHIVGAYLSMLEQFGSDVDFDTVLLPGPLLSDSVISELEARAHRLPVRIEHFVPDISGLLNEATVVVAMGGYNTVTEILSHARRAIIIPRETPRQEQLIRAQQLQARGVVKMLRIAELTPARLYEAVAGALGSSNEWVTEAREARTVPLDGAQRIVELLIHGVPLPEEVGAV
jgi:predicted glycosyltransferase